MKSIQVIAIVGPTASGKTALGVQVALQNGGEVISADSRQVYRGLDLGTGKVTQEEARGVPHHLIDVADPQEQFSVADFVHLGRAAISEIAARGNIPIIVGGTGMYVDALVGRLAISSVPPNPELRARLSSLSMNSLRTELQKIDPERYGRIDTKNPRRLIRAIEIACGDSTNKEQELSETQVSDKYELTWLGITHDWPELKKRITARLKSRLSAGMLDEARRLHENGLSYARMHELGLEYRIMAEHLQGNLPYEAMVIRLETEIYQYAKRQMVWFKRNGRIRWLI